MTMTTAPVEVYCVKITQLSTSTGIDWFTTKALLFADKDRAIRYAKREVSEYKYRSVEESDEDDDEEKKQRNEEEEEYEEDENRIPSDFYPYKGTAYFYTSGKPLSGHEYWPDFQVQVKKQKMNLDSGFKIEFSA